MARSRRKSKTPSRRDLRSGKGAFTLVELLVVIVILGLLMALLVPSLRGVWKRYNMTLCQSHLFHIYQAFRLRATDEAMGAKEAYPVAAWDGVLMPYLENDTAQFFCPETETVKGTPMRLISELVEFRSVVGGNTWYTQLEPGTYMLKLSDTQWNEARNLGFLANGGAADQITTKHPEFATYVPDGNPALYWLCMEDIGGDQDYKDVMTRVTENGDGTTTLECISGETNRQNSLMDKLTSTVIFTVPQNQWSFSPARTAKLETGGAESTYGMNEYGRVVGGAGGKILVLDYLRLEAKTTDLWADKFFDPSTPSSGVPNFARHFGMANVLFSDGSVHPERPADIDPVTTTVATKWWMP